MPLNNNKSRAAASDPESSAQEEAEVRRLVEGCKKGDPDSLRSFFDLYGKDIYSFPMRVFNMSEEDAGDFFLFAFERLRDGRRMRTFIGESRFRTWLYTVLRNLVIDWLRSRREVEIIPVERIEKEESRARSPGAEFESGEDDMARLLAQKLDQIPALHRVIFKLVYLYYVDLDEQDLAFLEKEYGISPAAALNFIMHEREDLAGREEENLKKEDALTHLYLSIHRLREKKDRLRGERGIGAAEAEEVAEKLDSALEKKYATRNKILERKKKGLLVARAPYRIVAGFLGMPEGSVSVYMGKVASFLTNDPDLKKLL